jgi:adhesin/invasin
MLIKAKRLPVMVMLVLIAVFIGSLSGCGDSADPLGTGIIQFYDVTTDTVITSTTTQPGGSVTLVVRVLNLRSDGKTLVPVIGEKVTFTLLTPGNGGGLTVVNDRTAGNGQAMAVFTAGNNSATDSVRATTGSGATASITITKTGGIVGARISTLAASATTVAAYQTSTVTATVTDGSASPMMGEAVTFTIPVNESDACFVNAASACVASVTVSTDASGRAVALYRGGGYDSYSAVSDTVRAALANGSSNALVIIRSAATPLSIAVTASPTSVTAGQPSIITATLTGDGKAGVLVNFTLALNNSGATLSASSAVTDGNGNAVVTYTAGGNNSAEDVSDSVRAFVGSISSSVTVVRTGTGLLAGNSITVIATPPTVVAGAGSSVITANVKNNLGAVSGVQVAFTVSGTGTNLSTYFATTDASGNAVTVFTVANGGLTTAGATVGFVTASITVDGNIYTASVVITNQSQ